jgi:hypothetical protein
LKPVCDSGPLFLRLGDGEASPLVLLLQWESDEKLAHVLLVLLLAPISPKRWQIDLVQGFCSMLGFGSSRLKFGENRPLFIGLLVSCRRAQGTCFIQNTTQIVKNLNRNRKGKIS